jgi:2-methylisocitrate lyase-like PEP mutase family enzyme
MRAAGGRITKPLMANMADGGKTPIRSGEALRALGYRLAIYPSMTGLAAAQVVQSALTEFKRLGTSDAPSIPLFSFKAFNSLIGFEDVWAFERRWAREKD